MEDGFTDKVGVALVEAMMINKTLRRLLLDARLFASDNIVGTKAILGAQTYEAFGAMLRVNTSIKLCLPAFDAGVGNGRDIENFKQMRIMSSD
jgi:hypothetical protein